MPVLLRHHSGLVYDPTMSANTSGRHLKVLTGGLQQLGARCESLGNSLSTAAAPSLAAVSTWQANAGAVNSASGGSCKDLAGLAARMGVSGAKYSEAGSSYTATDEDGAAGLRGLAH
jgi:hypothetical protein